MLAWSGCRIAVPAAVHVIGSIVVVVVVVVVVVLTVDDAAHSVPVAVVPWT